MRKNQADYCMLFWVGKLMTLGLLLVSLIACATDPKDKAKLQADKDWTQASAENQQLQGLMLQGSFPTQTGTTPLLAPASGQVKEVLLTSDEYRRREIERREEVYGYEWRVLEHEVAKRVLQRGVQNLDAPW